MTCQGGGGAGSCGWSGAQGSKRRPRGSRRGRGAGANVGAGELLSGRGHARGCSSGAGKAREDELRVRPNQGLTGGTASTEFVAAAEATARVGT